MTKRPNYVFDDELYHHGILGQRWGVRRFQNEDGTYTSEGLERRYTKEGYKSLKKEYRQDVKNADKEYVKITKESGKNRIQPNKKSQLDAIYKVDSFAYKKAFELYEKYKNVEMYKAKLKGKDFDTSKLAIKNYFGHIGIENEDLWDSSVPAIVYYSARQEKDNVKVRKNVYFYS